MAIYYTAPYRKCLLWHLPLVKRLGCLKASIVAHGVHFFFSWRLEALPMGGQK